MSQDLKKIELTEWERKTIRRLVDKERESVTISLVKPEQISTYVNLIVALNHLYDKFVE